VIAKLPAGDANREALRSAEKASERAANLTGKCSAFPGKVCCIRTPTSLKDVLEEVGALLQRTFDPRIDLELIVPRSCGKFRPTRAR